MFRRNSGCFLLLYVSLGRKFSGACEVMSRGRAGCGQAWVSVEGIEKERQKVQGKGGGGGFRSKRKNGLLKTGTPKF